MTIKASAESRRCIDVNRISDVLDTPSPPSTRAYFILGLSKVLFLKEFKVAFYYLNKRKITFLVSSKHYVQSF